jgi:hypothetical protein
MPQLFFGISLLALTLINVWATLAILRDTFSSKRQRVAQMAFVWLIPGIGAALALYLKRKDLEPGAGRYGEAPEVGDDFGMSGRSYRELKHDIDAMGHDAAGTGGPSASAD